MKITKRQLRRLIIEEAELLGEYTRDKTDVSRKTMSEGVMVSLKPITNINRPAESDKARWMRIAGISENEQLSPVNESSRAGETENAGYDDGSDGLDPKHLDNMDYMAGWETGNEDREYDIERGARDTDGDGRSDVEELEGIAKTMRSDATQDSLEKQLDIIDGDSGEIYADWEKPEWNDEPFSGMEADFEIWLSKNSSDYTRHPDAEKLSQEHGNPAWYVRNKHTELRTDHRTPPSQLVGKYNLPSGDWGIPEPDRGSTNEGTPVSEMSAAWQQILRNVI